MKIKLAIPESPFLQNDGLFPDLGILYIAAKLWDAGDEVGAFFFNAGMSDEELLRLIGDARVVAVTGTSAHDKAIKRMGQLKTKYARKIIGGAHATTMPKLVESYGYECILVGEGERKIDEVLSEYGIIYGVTPKPEEIPIPLRGLTDRERPIIYGRTAESMMVTRGCPYHCSFCAKTIEGYRMLYTDRIEAEVEGLVKQGVGTIIFYDDSFTVDKGFAVMVADIMGRHDLKFRISTRADKLDEMLLVIMKEKGLQQVCVGVESGSQEILDVLHKKTRVETNTKAREAAAKAGVRFKAYMMIGLPGESRDTVEESMRWIEENRPDEIGFYLYRPMPGSLIYDRPFMFDLNIEDRDGYVYAGRDEDITVGVSTSHLTASEIQGLYQDSKDRIRDMGIPV